MRVMKMGKKNIIKRINIRKMKRGRINKAAKITGYSYNTVKKYAAIEITQASDKIIHAKIHATIKALQS
jgi:hypothetical protein